MTAIPLPKMVATPTFTFDNIQDAEEVYQRCVLITGRCAGSTSDDALVEVETKNKGHVTTFPTQRWPMCQGYFRALVYLSPGRNYLFFRGIDKQQKPKKADAHGKLFVDYTPVLNAPPLHLAIMVAKDSPLLIDCPPEKHSHLSKTHSSLDAAIAKFRITALMWQAQTAEDLRAAGLGRRSFRLDEEWGVNTLTQDATRKGNEMASCIKVHIVRADYTVKDIRHKELAQQNEQGKNREGLHKIFKKALYEHGGPFLKEAKPIVAGLILDSVYDASISMILGHAALGAHRADGLSLGIFGSHLTYAWPRFFEEISDCLLDTTVPGDSVGNDNGECTTMWEACTVGQGAFLHEVGHAFDRPHTKGIMERGYSRDWAQIFLAKTAKSLRQNVEGIAPVTPETEHNCHWNFSDMVRFNNFPHFRNPTDEQMEPYHPDGPQVLLKDEGDDSLKVAVHCKAGFARVILDGKVLPTTDPAKPANNQFFDIEQLEKTYDRTKPLKLELLCMNGKEANYDLWSFLSSRSWIRVPGTNIRLTKKSVGRSDSSSDEWPWAVMLRKRDHSGKLINANKIDIRVGCGLDGAIVYYWDGTSIPCGPFNKDCQDHGMGGHQAKKIALPKGVDVVKIAVSYYGSESQVDGLEGLRMWLSNGKAMGALNKNQGGSIKYLEPEPGHKIIGFYGSSGNSGMAREFGIVTAPKDKELPDSLYDMPELQNNPKSGSGRASKRRKTSHGGADSGTEDDEDYEDITEDEDNGYDDGSMMDEDE